jgi:flagellin-like protein
MRTLLRNRRAVSSVLSTILLILVVVIGMSVAFGYFVTFVRDYQSGRGGSVMELASIEDVWFKTDRSTIDVWVYNYGKVDINISTAYINGQQLASFNEAEVSIGKHANMTLQVQWNSTIPYDLKLVTERGSVFEGHYVSPTT